MSGFGKGNVVQVRGEREQNKKNYRRSIFFNYFLSINIFNDKSLWLLCTQRVYTAIGS